MRTFDYFWTGGVGFFIPAFCTLFGVGQTVDYNCDYKQHLEENHVYYVYSPGYPGYYRFNHFCRWVVTAPQRIRLNCTEFSIPYSNNCTMDSVTIQTGPNLQRRFCGKSSFVLDSEADRMQINFQSSFWSTGGRFLCTLTAIKNEDDNNNNNCRCGWKNPQRIVGGTETGVNEFPMAAGLVDLELRLIFCGATIISEQYVLTAAHCLTRDYSTIDNLAVVVGEHDITTGTDTNATQIFRTDLIIIHPEYEEDNDSNDIGIVRTIGKIIFTSLVGPACLPFKYQRTNFTGAIVTVVGWGTVEFGGEKSDVLMKADVNVISQARCAEYFSKLNATQLCTYKAGKDSCQFDSGGGVLWESAESRRLFVLGAISFGIGCGDDKPGVNTRVSKYLDFIQRVTPGTRYCHSF